VTVAAAHKNALAAEEALRAAERARNEAYDDLDQALRMRGWQRLFGGFDARLYNQLGGEAVGLDDVVAYETRAAA
jgi:hypothetical protein